MLTQQITYLNKLSDETKILTLDHNPVFEKASLSELTSKLLILYALIVFEVVLLLLINLIFLRSYFCKLNFFKIY